MKTHRGFCASFVLAAWVLSGCAGMEPAGRESPNAVESLVRNRLANDSVATSCRVHVDVAPGGTARVRGRVPDVGTAARIMAIVESTPGVSGAENLLSIQPWGNR